MARRQREGFGQGSLDSLLDTMTNVVGVLIVVLIVTQVNVSSAAKRIRANLPDVTVRMMAQLQERDETVRQRLEELELPQEVMPGEVEAAKLELRELLARRDDLRESAREVTGLQNELAELRREIDAMRQEMESKGGQMAQIRSELEEKQAQLTNRKPRLVRLPNPREPDEGAKEVRMIVRGGRLLHFDKKAILDRLAARIKPRKDLLSADPKFKGRYDYDKIKAFLGTLRESDPDFRLGFVIHPANGHIRVHCDPRDEAGETIEELEGAGSQGRRVMAQAFGDRNYIRYFVTADSFEEYMTARRLAENIQLPVGWVFAGDAARQSLSLDERKIRATPDPDYEPPEPKEEPDPKPSPPPPPKETLPKDILD